MVKAIQIHHTGGPEVLAYEEVALAPPGPGEVQIRHHAIGVNFIDIYFRIGQYPSALPFIPGGEGAGEIMALGEGVENFAVGQRVAYAGPNGAYAQARNIPAKFVVPLPDSISYDTAAAMMLKGLTAEYLLFRSYPAQKGDIVLVHAAAGGVGLILCQWAKSLGATVIGTVGTAEKAERAKAAGADVAILYAQENFVEKVRDFTKGKLCHAVYDGVGKTTFPASLDCLRPLGSFISFGSSSGPVEAFNIGLLAQKGSLYAQRPTLFTYISDEARMRDMAARLFAAVESGAVKIAIDAKIPLEQAAKAHIALASRATSGATVLLP